jgi:hypothetical protein
MEIPKEKILQMLRDRGDQQKADEADKELPAQVDPEKHGGMLSKYGIDPGELAGKLPGGVGDKLGL